GYDINERSGSNYGYLVYLIIFFAIWGLVVLSLLSSATAVGLQAVAAASPGPFAVLLLSALLLAWWLWALYGAARRSPIRFSGEDAALVCSTPTPRPGVVFAWSLSDWLQAAVPFWGLAVVLGFALTEIRLGDVDIWENLPAFLANGFRFFLPVLLAQAGMFAVTRALGCYRLQRDADRRWLALVPLALAGLLAFAVLTDSLPDLAALPGLVPAAYPAGLAAGLVWLAGGTALLYAAARSFNLSRAAQETEYTSSLAAASMLGNTQLAESIQLKQRLGTGSPPARIPTGRGAGAITWKRGVQSARSLSVRRVLDWGLLFALALGALVAPDWGSRAMVTLFLLINIHKKTTEGLQNNLGFWPLYQTLPTPPRSRLAAELAPAVLMITLLGWAAFAVSRMTGLSALPLGFALLLPLLVTATAAAAAHDVLRQAKAENLLIGQTQPPGIVAVLLSGLAVAATGLILYSMGSGLPGLTAALLIDLMICWWLVNLCARSFQQLGR
ncbi:MAG TPA: hypothetical protein VFF68_06255, partial [Anaerolineaceae bacterium]|nr:hypothetical protein [Anaerolineaceae bacterium]